MPPPALPTPPSASAKPSGSSARARSAGSGGRALTIVAIADDPTLLDAISRAGGERDLVITSPTADRFVDQLVANSAAIAVIDATCAPPPLDPFIERIHAQFPQLLLILAGSAPLQAACAARLVDGTLFRFAHKPASAQRMQLFVEAARRHLEAGVAAADAPLAEQDLEADLPRPTSPLRTAALGGVLLLAVVAALWWYLYPGARTPAAPVPSRVVASVASAPAPAVTVQREPVASPPPLLATTPPGPFLQMARARLASHQLIEPTGDSALFYVEAAQALAPQDPEVDATALALGEALIAQARAALNAGDADAARRWVRACTEYRVSQNTLAELSARLEQLEAAPAAGAGPATP